MQARRLYGPNLRSVGAAAGGMARWRRGRRLRAALPVLIVVTLTRDRQWRMSVDDNVCN